MELYELNTAKTAEAILSKVAQTPGLSEQTVFPSNPSRNASFPCAVVSEILARQKYGGWCYTLSVRVEVWAQDIYTAMQLHDLVRMELARLHLKPSGTMPELYDEITEMVRYGNYYECRWNAVSNSFEPNR